MRLAQHVRLICMLLALSFGAVHSQNLWPDYAGKQACFGCHTTVKPIDLAEFNKSGHPWKVQPIDRSKVDANGVYKPFPAGTNESGVPLAPEVVALGFTYTASDSNIGFLIGGYGWKARWMNKQGYIYKGTKAQYNLGTIHSSQKGHGAYDASQVNNQVFALQTPPAVYNCGSCHTTGWKAYNETTQPVRYNNLPGFDGTFFEWGVQCEGCHGPSKNHVDNPTIKPTKDGFTMCKSCHARSQGVKIAVKSDKQLLDHREQYDQMLYTKHRRTANMTCVTCHDPHKSTVYDRGGLKEAAKTCKPCHDNKSNITMTIVRGGSTTQAVHTCKDCHMPYIGNTAVKQNNNRGDQASHIWKINTAAVNKFAGMFTPDSLAVKIPADSVVAQTLDFSCLGCHTTRDLTWASNYATGIHANNNIVVNVETKGTVVPSAYYIEQNYPNPFNPSTTIRFGIPEASNVRVDVYDLLGQHVATLLSTRLNAGLHSVIWNGKDASGKAVASGVYLYRLETDKFIDAKRMVLTK